MSEQPEDRKQNIEDENRPMSATPRMIWFIVIAAAVVVFVVRNFETTKNILLVLLGFGAVVIVHEFGHFVVAKLCGIKVEAFSIFMPPTLIGIKKVDQGYRIRILPELFKKEKTQELAEDEGLYSFTFGKKPLPGETEYRIGLIPFGGFVKMLGQEDVGAAKESQDSRSFANKPALVRAAVLAAGVTFNVISAAIVYIIVFLVGINLAGPVVGGVMPDSPAQRAGILPGDEVIEVGGEDGRLDFSDVVMAAVLSGRGKEIPLKIRHEDGAIEDVNLAAEELPGVPYRTFGINRPLTLTIAKLGAQDANLLKKNTGLLPGDRVKAVDGEDVDTYWQFEKIVQNTFEPNVTLLAQRNEKLEQEQLVEGHLNLAFPAGESEYELANVCGIVPRMRIIGVTTNFKDRLRRLFHLKEKGARLKPGDIIAAVGDINDPTYSEMRAQTKEYKNKKLPVKVIRSDANGVKQLLTIETTPRENDSNRVIIGIVPELDVEDAVVADTITTAGQPEALKIPRGARITAVDGVEVNSFFDIARELKKNSGERVTIDWRIDAEKAGNIAIEVGPKEQVVTAKAIPKEDIPFKQIERLYKADGPLDAVGMGYKRTKIFVIQAYITLQRLLGGLVSPKELMGPVGILTMSYKIVADHPLIYYVYFLGLISASIAVLNFLPIPPFDGGLVMLLLVEKIKGSAISLRTQEIIAYAAWAMLIALLLYVTFNDIARLITG